MANTKEELFITTLDNPFDPFKQFTEWYMFDIEHQYYTCAYIDRILSAHFPNINTNEASDEQVDDAIKTIVELNPLMYKVVSHEVEDDKVNYYLDHLY